MPLRELDANVSHRSSFSRSSDISTKPTRAGEHGLGSASQLENISQSVGVQSMLKTTTEDDLSLLAPKSSRLPRHLYAPSGRPHGVPSSRASSHYSRTGSRAGSIRSKSSNKSTSDQVPADVWPYVHYPRVDSLDGRHNRLNESNRIVYPSSRSLASIPDRFDIDQESQVHAQDRRLHRLNGNHRSVSSLRNLTNISARPCSPQLYPARLRRPGYRPASPALSDTNVLAKAPRSYIRPGLQPRPLANLQFTPGDKITKASSPLRPPGESLIPQAVQMVQVIQNSTPPRSKLEGSTTNGARDRYALVATPALREDQYAQRQSTITSLPSNGIGQSGSRESTVAHNVTAAPYVGFVKRVKQALEERALLEGSPWTPKSYNSVTDANGTKLEGQDGSELSSEVKRLTRDMIKAAVGPPSDSGAVSPIPDNPDATGVESLTESSSFHACTSVEIPRAPSTPMLQSSTDQVSMTVENTESPNAEITSTCDNIADQPVVHCLDSSNAVEPTSNTESEANLDNVAINSKTLCYGGIETLKEAAPITDSNVGKRPSSLPQPQLDHCVVATSDRRSLPALATLDGTSFLTSTHTPQPDSTSSAFLSLSSLQTEENLTEGAATGPCSTHSFFRSSSNASTDHSRLSAFKSYFKSKSRPFSALSELRSDADVTNMEQQPKFQEHAQSLSLPPQRSKVIPSRAGSELYEGMEPFVQSTNVGSDRLSAMKQYQFTLPDLAEDSQEDASTTNLRMLGSRPPNFRSGAVKKTRKENRISTIPSTTLEPPASYVSKNLRDTRNMPSLQFSQTDLTTKLNLALGLPCPLPQDNLEPLMAQDVEERSRAATIPARQRYKSYFFGLENITNHEIRGTEIVPETDLGQTVLLTEIDRLSIPSVNGLTIRLSELLPEIKKCPSQFNLEDLDDNAVCLAETSQDEDTRGTEGSTARPTTNPDILVTTRRRSSENDKTLSAGLDMLEVHKNYLLMKDLPPLPREATNSFLLSIGPRTNHLTQQELTENGPAELEATVPIETATANKAISGSIEPLDTAAATASSQQKQSTALQAGNHVQSNRSASTNLTSLVDITPLKATARSTSTDALGADNQCINGLTPDTTERIVRSMSPGPHVETFLVPQSLTANELEESNPGSKSILGSIQKKMGKKPRIDKAGFPVDPIFLHPEERSTEPGDRYPTSGLTPPSHVNIAEARSYFSDDSSDNGEPSAGPFRKRLTKFRYRTSRTCQSSQSRGPSRTCSVPDSGRDVHSGLRWEDEIESHLEQSSLSASHPDMVVVYDQQPVGMSKLEFRAKRFVEKLRIFWSKSETLIRSMSRARKQHPSDWAETTLLYEGA